MSSTALGAEKEKAIIFISNAHEKFYYEKLKEVRYTLRHSLASRLLEHEIPLPVISEILGHTTTETTMAYLRIDISELRKCALEVAI